MKKNLFALSLIVLVLFGCKENKKKFNPEETKTSEKEAQKKDSLTTLKGEFIYTADAAVIKGNGFIYGVVIDSMSTVLSKKVAPLKQEDFDMVPVVIQGKVKPNPSKEGWDEVVEIKKIDKVSKPTSASINPEGKQQNKETSK